MPMVTRLMWEQLSQPFNYFLSSANNKHVTEFWNWFGDLVLSNAKIEYNCTSLWRNQILVWTRHGPKFGSQLSKWGYLHCSAVTPRHKINNYYSLSALIANEQIPLQCVELKAMKLYIKALAGFGQHLLLVDLMTCYLSHWDRYLYLSTQIQFPLIGSNWDHDIIKLHVQEGLFRPLIGWHIAKGWNSENIWVISWSLPSYLLPEWSILVWVVMQYREGAAIFRNIPGQWEEGPCRHSLTWETCGFLPIP